MAAITPEEKAVLAKSAALIVKTRSKLERLDPATFPTESSKLALKLLSDALRGVSDPVLMGPMDPLVLYNRLIKFQELVEDVEESNCDHISWPLVSHCDDIWRALFGKAGPHIFYSVTKQHNYSIKKFSVQVKRLLDPLLPTSELTKLEMLGNIYCLHLASLEDANLPLYANIAHEFGHAVYDAREKEILAQFISSIDPVLNLVINDIAAIDAPSAPRRVMRSVDVLLGFARELFSDLVGALLLGPAFFLSLYEMSWGSSKSQWMIGLRPQRELTSGYPSFYFRLDCIKTWADLAAFENNAKREFARLRDEHLRRAPLYLAGLRTMHNQDDVVIIEDVDQDGPVVRKVLQKHLVEMKAALRDFLESCRALVTAGYSSCLAAVGVHEVAELLLRLESDVLPNIIPDGSLKGKPATFKAILNASALFRLNIMLESASPVPNDSTSRNMAKVERLTAKALEVSYIQQRYDSKKRKP